MSKRQSTLFNYFQSPKTPKINTPRKSTSAIEEKQNNPKDYENVNTTPKKHITIGNGKKMEKAESDSDDEIVRTKKRSRIQVMDESSESDSDPSQTPDAKKLKSLCSNSEDENIPPKKVSNVNKASSTPTSKKLASNFSFSKRKTSEKSEQQISEEKTAEPINLEKNLKDIHSNWLHNDLDFLQPNKIMDMNKKKPSDPEYDPTTLYVPEAYLKTLSPAMRQWWDLKRNYWDTVLFFKVGKFYELYHMDAVVGVQHLGFSYMKGDFAHSGFPETAYGKMASLLIDRGYKVARCEQTETPEMMEARCKGMAKATKYDRVVRREICQVSSKAATVFTAQMTESLNAQPNYMFALSLSNSSDTVKIGICFVETSLGTFRLAEFIDDKHFSKLLTLLTEYPAALILYEKGGLSKDLSKILDTQFKDIRKESLIPKKQFLTASDTLEKLCAADYFKNKKGDFSWPEMFKKVADDCLPKKDYQLALSSLGACLWYLKNSKLDIQVFSIGKFELYDPMDYVPSSQTREKEYLILDVTTIINLNLLGTKDSLHKSLDSCKTAFGKRLLHQWICKPLCNIEKIQERQKAIAELWNTPELLENAQNILKTLPDLERLLTKIHIYGNKLLTVDHPDSRAIFYEAATYSKKKIQDLVKTLRAFEKVQEIPDIFKSKLIFLKVILVALFSNR